MPARSKSSHDVSSSSRCWGSMASASRGEMPKRPASNRARSRRNAPSRAQLVPRDSGSGS